jgi:hypothetical protein
MKSLHILLTGLLINMFIAGLATAQQAQQLGFAVSPAIFEVGGDPGDVVEGAVTFQNTSDFPVAGFISSDTLVPIDNIIDQARRSQFDASSWIEFDETSLAFDQNADIEVDFKVAIPEDANPGAHYALITLRPGAIQNESTDTLIAPELSASVFITVSGEINESAELIEDDLQLPNLTRNTSNKINFRVRNVGNVHILPSPKVTILKDGKPVEIFTLQPQLILPNTEKTFEVDWETNVDFGRYSVQAELVYGNESIPLASSEYEFLVLPNLMQIFLLVLLLPIVIFVLLKRKNIPRTMAVLRGHANFNSKNYSRPSGSEDLPKPTQGTRTIDEIADEIEKTPNILGYPDISDEDFFEENKETPANKKPKQPKPDQPTKVISKTRIQEESKTTFITQTSASTIVRERSPFFDPETDEPQEAKKIEVKHATDSKPKAAHEKTKKKPTKKAAAKKKTPSKKKAPAKKVTKKTTVKKPAKTTKTSPKKAANKKPVAKKPVTKKATMKKKSTTKKTTAKKSSTAVKKKAK